MAFKTISGICEITTGEYSETLSAPVYQDEICATLLSIDFTEDGSPFSVPGTAYVKFYYDGKYPDTADIEMTISGDNASLELPAALTAISGKATAFITIIDTGFTIVACEIPITIRGKYDGA